MNVPYRWLREYVDIDVSAEELSHRLTMAGLEAEKIEEIGDTWDKVYVAVVRKVSPHPDADRLVLADVDAGEHRLTVVTGAPNIAEGQKVALALAGARLIDAYADTLKYKTLKPGKIRGVTSEGMVCSEKELGLSDEHEGILVLESDAPTGTPLRDWLGDKVIEFEITPNLVHAFSMVGMAREASAVMDAPFTPPALADLTSVPTDDALVTVDASGLCRRYCTIVIDGISIAPSPPWLARRLAAAGVRPINNIVDVTNYVMLEMGQPLHAFDRETISSGHINVRRGRPGEQVETLDHRVRDVDDSTLLIADGDRAVGIAGVMGGVNSEVSESTTAIFLESANFDMTNIRHTSRMLKLRTDASVRFERGLDPANVLDAARRAVHLILALCPEARVISRADAYPNPVEPSSITMPFDHVERVLGVRIDPADVVSSLDRLGLQPELDDTLGTLKVTVPTWRSDISIPEDVVEEIARIVGYDSLPATLPTGPLPPIQRDPMYLLERTIRHTLASAGLYEGRTYVAISESDIRQWASNGSFSLTQVVDETALVKLRNPVNTERPVLRTNIAPTLLRDVAENLKHEAQVKLFEIAHVFAGTNPGELPDEPVHLGIVMTGARHELDRFHPPSGPTEELDFWDAKGVLDALFTRLGVSPTFETSNHPALHPGRTATISIGSSPLGMIGELHPDRAAATGIDSRVTLAEVNLTALLELLPTDGGAITVDHFLPVEQDFSIVVSDATPAATVEQTLRAGAGPLVSQVTLFDEYRGQNLAPGTKSLAFRITFTAPDRALTDKELSKTRTRIERILKKQLDASLRV